MNGERLLAPAGRRRRRRHRRRWREAVNLMLDEIERLLDQLRSIGDNIAHDLRTPLMVARTRIARALDEDAGDASCGRRWTPRSPRSTALP